MSEKLTGIPYDEMPKYIEQYQEEIENLTNSALQLNKIVKKKQKTIDNTLNYIEQVIDYVDIDEREYVRLKHISDMLKGGE